LKSFFCPLLGRHPGIVTKRCEFAAQVMRTDAGFYTDQASWYIGERRFNLATRPLLFLAVQSRVELPKIAANDRAKATPEEAQSIVGSSIA
jgi:hypothetical protein